MQDNEPLMKALAKLVGVNNPDLVLFVGEALVGNDSVDQLTKFNRAVSLARYSPPNSRLIISSPSFAIFILVHASTLSSSLHASVVPPPPISLCL